MNKKNKLKSLCALLLIISMVCGLCPNTFIMAKAAGPSVTIVDNGSRLVAKVENIDAPAYQWQKKNMEGEFVNIEGATNYYYDLTTEDSGSEIKVVVGEYESTLTEKIGNVIIFDLALGRVTFDKTYSGKGFLGEEIIGTHEETNIYVVKQSNNENFTINNIRFVGNHPDDEFDVTLDGVHMGRPENRYPTYEPNTSTTAPYDGSVDTGLIDIPAAAGSTKKVILRIKDENITRYIHYYSASSSGSSLKITDINGDGAVDGGSLYIPKKVEEQDIDEFINSKKSYNHWNSGIGGDDGSGGNVYKLHIAGGNIQVLTNYGDNCTAIGAGGNGYCQMEISGGNVVAHCNGTGAAIGGGIGWFNAGGRADITISGGNIYAKNHGEIRTLDGAIVSADEEYDEVVGGVAIGAGSSFHATGSEGKVTVTGGTVEAYGTFGNGMGGGNSSSKTGGKATINIKDGTVIASSIGGGNSKAGIGGTAEVMVDSPADITLLEGIGGGDSMSGDGGEATINVNGGTMNCGGVIGGGNGGTTGTGGKATIKVFDGTLTAQSVGGGVGGEKGNGGAAEVYISGGKIETGSIGGGSTLNPDGKLGYAKAEISDGDISGQFLMAAGGTEPCSFVMTGGTLHGMNTVNENKYDYVSDDGAAVFMDDPNGIVTISGGTIKDCYAQNGGAIYMTAGEFTISGTAVIENCTATQDGGAVYLGGGYAYVRQGGNVIYNTAYNNGGAIAITNGNYEMTGGNVDGNESKAGDGGGIYVSAEGKDVSVKVLSGSVSNNKASLGRGGAVTVEGKQDGTETIEVIVGVNEKHFDANGNRIDCEHGSEGSLTCPVMKNNYAELKGGAIFVTGSDKATLRMYCLEEKGSISGGEKQQSDFMKMEGGTVVVSTSQKQSESEQTAMFGNIHIENSIYVTGGKIDIWGEMTNPYIADIITVDIAKEGDHFIDHRINDEYYKLIYFENFIDPVTGIRTGQYKEKAIIKGGSENISGSIYEHPGYIIVGWNTDKDQGDNFPAKQEDGTYLEKGWFYPGDEVPFDDKPITDLTIYAIWEPNANPLIYDPNVPEGDLYTGEMEDGLVVYDLPYTLAENKYLYPGHEFLGWSMDADATDAEYEDGATVNNLTTKVGEKIVLYAIWKDCDHDPLTHRYTYTVIDEGKTLKRECSCKGYLETVVLYAEDTVYNQKEHPAEVTYSAPEKWKPVLVYSHEGVVMGTVPKNAGTYVASVSGIQVNEDGNEETVTASVTYTIDKAEQPAPPKPKYEAEDGKIKVYSVDDSPLKSTDNTYDSHKEYQVVYIGANGERISSGWQAEAEIEGGFVAEFNLDVAYTNYFVYARYSEGKNYKASPETQANSEYYFHGIGVTIEIIPGEGIDHVATIDQTGTNTDTTINGIGITVTEKEGYYIPDDFAIIVETAANEGFTLTNKAKCTTKEEYKEYMVESIPNNSHVTIKIGNAKKLPEIKAKIVEKQVFEEVKNAQANISRDSSYTAYYEVSDYDITAYSKLELKFSSVLETGTTIIMLDKKNNTYYWTAIDSSVESIDLTSFTQMGTADTKFAIAGEEIKGVDLQLQFIIDFSKTENGEYGEALTTTLEATKAAEKNRTPELSAVVNATLANKSGFSLNTSGSGLAQNLSYIYSASSGVVSRWDYCHAALVLKEEGETNLPSDATLKCTIDGTTTIIFANAKNEFVIPVAGPQSGNVEVTLQSNLFPTEEMTYGMTAKWYVAQSIAEDAISNGILVASENISFQNAINTTPSLKVTVDGDKRLYSINDIVKATFRWEDIAPGSTMKLSLERKLDSGEYGGVVQTVDYEDKDELVQEFLLGGESAGSYRLHIYVLNNLVNVGEAYYYFIIE